MTKSDYEKKQHHHPGAVAMGNGRDDRRGASRLDRPDRRACRAALPLSFIVGAIGPRSAPLPTSRFDAVSVTGGTGMILEEGLRPDNGRGGRRPLDGAVDGDQRKPRARTFGTYTLRAFGGDPDSILVPISVSG